MLVDLIKTCKACNGKGRIKSYIWKLYYINLARHDLGHIDGFDPEDKPIVPKYIKCQRCGGTGKRLSEGGRYFVAVLGDSLKKYIPQEDTIN